MFDVQPTGPRLVEWYLEQSSQQHIVVFRFDNGVGPRLGIRESLLTIQPVRDKKPKVLKITTSSSNFIAVFAWVRQSIFQFF
jgi:hypothetical protein